MAVLPLWFESLSLRCVPGALPAALALAGLLAGCAAPVQHALPDAPVPAAWKEGAAAQPGFWHPATPGEGVQADWWAPFRVATPPERGRSETVRARGAGAARAVLVIASAMSE